jgi:cytoskeletal protein CcmA (bactofilin family)
MSRLTALVMLVIVAVTVFMGALPASAERTQSDFVLIREGETVSEDLYAAGDLIVIQGLVEGDLIAAAYTEIRIEGEVRGSVVAIASKVVVDGAVGGSVRAAALTVEINGSVGEDVFVGGLDVMLGSESEIGRDALMWANDVAVAGRIERNVEGQFRTGTVAARVEGDVDITVSNLTVGPSAAIAGDLIYVGDERAVISDDAEVGGSVIAESELAPYIRIRALFLLVRVLVVIAMVALGLGLIWSIPERSRKAARGVFERPLVALAWGGGLASIPIAMALIVWLFVSLSPRATGLPLLLVFSPILIAAFAALFVGLLSAPVPVGAAIGKRIGPARSIYAWFIIGATVLVLLSFLPLVGTIVLVVGSLIGLGGWFVEPRPAEPTVTGEPSALRG